MKKCITSTQFRELKPEVRKKLVGHSDTTTKQYIEWEKNEPHYQRMTVGKMIEILDNSVTAFYIIPVFDTVRETKEGYKVETIVLNVDSMDEQTYESKELCDALWSAVKEVLGE